MKNAKTRRLYFLLAVLLLAVITAVFLFCLKDAAMTGGFSHKEENLKVCYFDVDQGDAALICLPTGEAILIDTGPSYVEERLLADIRQEGVHAITYLILTHPHDDHIGGADAVLKSFPVEHVLINGGDGDGMAITRFLDALQDSSAVLAIAEAGQVYSCGEAVISVLGPGKTYEEENNNSLVIRIDYRNTSFLFTGDMEQQGEADLIAQEKNLNCNVLKVGHHGSANASTEEFLKKIMPEIAVISCMRGNSHGHPDFRVLQSLEAVNSQIYRTDRDGTVIVVSDGTTVWVE